MVSLSRRRAPGEERGYTVTMPAALYAEIQHIAAEEGRSMNKQIQRAIQEHVEARRRRTPAKTAAAA